MSKMTLPRKTSLTFARKSTSTRRQTILQTTWWIESSTCQIQSKYLLFKTSNRNSFNHKSKNGIFDMLKSESGCTIILSLISGVSLQKKIELMQKVSKTITLAISKLSKAIHSKFPLRPRLISSARNDELHSQVPLDHSEVQKIKQG